MHLKPPISNAISFKQQSKSKLECTCEVAINWLIVDKFNWIIIYISMSDNYVCARYRRVPIVITVTYRNVCTF